MHVETTEKPENKKTCNLGFQFFATEKTMKTENQILLGDFQVLQFSVPRNFKTLVFQTKNQVFHKKRTPEKESLNYMF